jgi:hypothetical protein
MILCRRTIYFFVLLLFANFLFSSCQSNSKSLDRPIFNYNPFKDSLKSENRLLPIDSSNLFDKGNFIPSEDSVTELLVNIDTVLARLKRQVHLTEAERTAIVENLRMIDSFLTKKDSAPQIECREYDCPLYVMVNKSKQLLFLYIEGELKDSFPVSTGKKNYTTPNMNTRPAGPVFTRYTSRKFPGGNYQGLGNMPYAVFIKGGYAIHGTTPGNFSKLGRIASHGCIRLHPDNARIFFELVKLYGLSKTWVSVSD